MPTNRPSEADVRGLMELIDASHNASDICIWQATRKQIIAICEDWLRLNGAAQRLSNRIRSLTEPTPRPQEPPHA